ncbi:MAG: hypothetical protein HOW73_49560 [Polyangiaceae bacterium]|nr:hypothetical protein [Polyangiaceae bacterium]
MLPFKAFISLAALAALTACGSTTEQPARPVGPAAVTLGDIPDVYRAFGYNACRAGDNCARTFSVRVGVDLGTSGTNAVDNPRAQIKNPDPEWIPEWSRLPEGKAGAHYAFEALALAAIHKSYRADCDKAYAAYDRDLTARLDKLDKDVAAKNRDPNPYDRLAGLLSLEPPKPDKSRMHAFAEGSDPVRYRWETAVFEAFEDTKRTFVYGFDGYAPNDALLGVMYARQPKDFEQDAFCMMAASGKVAGIAPLPDTSSWDSGVRSMVRLYVPDERAQQIRRREGELADVTRAKFAKVKVANPQLPPGVREMSLGKVESFSRDGKKAIVTSLVTREEQQGSKRIVSDDRATAMFDDWPSGVVLEPNDSVSFYGAEVAVQELQLKSTPEVEHRSRQYQLDGKHVTKIVSKGKTTVYFR